MSTTPTSEIGDALEPDQNPQTTDQPKNSNQEWKPALEYGWREERWLNEDSGELSIQEVQDWMETDAEYRVMYREGRFGASEELQNGEFDELNEAEQYLEQIIEGEKYLEELRT